VDRLAKKAGRWETVSGLRDKRRKSPRYWRMDAAKQIRTCIDQTDNEAQRLLTSWEPFAAFQILSNEFVAISVDITTWKLSKQNQE
jgi:hypothetical protein